MYYKLKYVGFCGFKFYYVAYVTNTCQFLILLSISFTVEIDGEVSLGPDGNPGTDDNNSSHVDPSSGQTTTSNVACKLVTTELLSTF